MRAAQHRQELLETFDGRSKGTCVSKSESAFINNSILSNKQGLGCAVSTVTELDNKCDAEIDSADAVCLQEVERLSDSYD